MSEREKRERTYRAGQNGRERVDLVAELSGREGVELDLLEVVYDERVEEQHERERQHGLNERAHQSERVHIERDRSELLDNGRGHCCCCCCCCC